MGDLTTQKKRLELHKEFLKSADNWNSDPEYLKLTPGYDPESIEMATAFFELDHADPSHLLMLTLILADVVFGKRKPGPQKGDKSVWNEQKSDYLAFAYFDLRRRHPDYADTEIADLICKIEKFNNYDSETLRKKLVGLRRTYESWADESEVFKYAVKEIERD
jgi:hypothetical protein